ncbi:hypothetical protein H6P81_015371 [Aristolochia fimbriata]|uniref:Coenzyme Q-binding protein COQ10 START domain-containing protein n=1 Tax=Aristolochia fimbriata TaxID=158543 RepID=A0AAV7E888_ARIFI|nr:hypothetical protein H6P81_015371 [Aristolochia fimbriata]
MIISKPSNLSFAASLHSTCRIRRRGSGFSHLNPSSRHRPKVFALFSVEGEGEERGGHIYRQGRSKEKENGLGRDRRGHCEVDVVSWRERRVRAWISVEADVESVWNVLTDYEKLADFIPNLVCSGRIPCPHPGRIWLEQRGFQRALYWHIEARVVLDLQEFPHLVDGRELHFSMVDGDFKKFEGKWSVKPGVRSCMTTLSYEVSVIPRFNFPAILLERIIRSDLPVNLGALAWRAERISSENLKPSVFGIGSVPATASKDSLTSSSLSGFSSKTEKHLPDELKGNIPSSDFRKFNSNWRLFGKVCRTERPRMVDEVHLRRSDGLLENGGVHRCVVASITVKAPVREVWNVLTAYEILPEIVPNLAISKILSRENNKVRILQEGCKGLLYMVLHARVVLDLWEQLEQEIRFEQVEGDFDSFQGKWLLERLGSHHTLLKYTVESKMHKNSFLSEAIFEEVIYEDLPSNLCAIRDFVEDKNGSISPVEYPEKVASPACDNIDTEHNREVEQVSTYDSPCSSGQKPRVPGLQRDIEILKSELLKFISEFGQEGFMPLRKQLRLHGRVDIEKAITRMGGFRKIASLMNLSLAYKERKPKGYWDSLENLRKEISRFQRSWGMDPAYMPSRKAFERAGRYDIARALEKWGGLHEASRLLSLKVRHPTRQTNTANREKRKNGADPSDPQKKPENGSKLPLADRTEFVSKIVTLQNVVRYRVSSRRLGITFSIFSQNHEYRHDI